MPGAWCVRVAVEKGRYADRRQRMLYPVGTFNSWTARPLSASLAALRLTPNHVSLLSLLVSLAGFALVATGAWRAMAGGALLVHLGLVLDHADGQVARRRGLGSTWGMYVDMVIDRIVEVGLIVAVAAAAAAGAAAAPGPLPAPWTPMSVPVFLVVCSAALGTMMTWRFLSAYNDVLYLRSHLVQTQRLPAADAAPRSLARRPLIPLVFNRDWVLLFWVVGVAAGQIQATVLLLWLLHALVTVEKIVVFRVRHREPEGDARRILGKDYH